MSWALSECITASPLLKQAGNTRKNCYALQWKFVRRDRVSLFAEQDFGFPAFIYLFTTSWWLLTMHIFLFLMSGVFFKIKACPNSVRRTGLWFLTQQDSCLARHWLEQLLFFGSHRTRCALLQVAPWGGELPSHAVWAGLLCLLPQGLFTSRG